jgi:hypothetical protein
MNLIFLMAKRNGYHNPFTAAASQTIILFILCILFEFI